VKKQNENRNSDIDRHRAHIPVNFAKRPVRAPAIPPTKRLNPVINACAGFLGVSFSVTLCMNKNVTDIHGTDWRY
jgi:hypothetical protein